MATVKEIDERIAEIDERIGEIEASQAADTAKKWHHAILAAKTAYKPKKRGLFGRKKEPVEEPDWEQIAADKLGGMPDEDTIDLCREYSDLAFERKDLSGAKFEMVRSGKSTLQVNLEESRARQVQRQKRSAGLICPKCGSENVSPVGSTAKSFSAGKAVVGAMVAGTAGAVIGASMGTKGKTKWVCRNCGHCYER